MFWEVALVPPNNPANTGIYEAELVAASVDRLYSREFEVPLEPGFGMCKRGNEATRGSLEGQVRAADDNTPHETYIDMDGDGDTCLFLVFV